MVDLTTGTLDNGVRVVAVRQGTGPLVEARLHLPVSSLTARARAGTAVLASCLSSRCLPNADPRRVAEEASVDVTAVADPRQIVVSAGSAAAGVDGVLRCLVRALCSDAPDDDQLARERDQVISEVRLTAAYPSAAARAVLYRHLFGDHPVTHLFPDQRAVASVDRAAVAALLRHTIRPAGATLVIVGPLDPPASVAAAARIMADWRTDAVDAEMPPVAAPRAGDVRMVDAPGAPHSQIRLRAPAVSHTDPRHPALFLACNVFAAYTSSRLVRNLREEKGFAYGVSGYFDAVGDYQLIAVEVDTAAENTAQAMEVIGTELGAMSADPPTADEIADARWFALGSMETRLSSRAAWAAALADLAGVGSDPRWLLGLGDRLRRVGVAEVMAVADEFFAPERFCGVVVGNPAATRAAALCPPDRTPIGRPA